MIHKMKNKINNQKNRNKALAWDIKILRKREIEIIKRWDLDDIDLITERLKLKKWNKTAKISKGNSSWIII